MIYTSYFAMLKKIEQLNQDITKSTYIPISICAKVPNWYTGLQYKKIAPKWSFFNEWKKNHDNEFYIKHFNEEVLKPLNQIEVLEDLYSLLDYETKNILQMFNCPPWSNPDINLILLCYEKPEDFCHRHLIADWLNQSYLSIHVEELIL